jgi:catechol 2,3-dioxygenase-like lactoylglutathione lyase family enzyme
VIRLGFPVIGVTDLERATAFWTAALSLTAAEEWASPGWRTLVTAGGDRALALMTSTSPAEPRPRLHLDLFVDTTDEQEAEIRRLLELGATETDWDSYPPQPDFVVLADPDGNHFCVVDRSRAPSGGSAGG